MVYEYEVSLLAYSITSNHTHLLMEANGTGTVSTMMQKLEGQFAEWYNRRKHRSGAFWGDRYHSTMVDSGEYAWSCMKYIDLNMVRAGVVNHPRLWRWCDYDELSGKRQRYCLIDRKAVLKWIGCFSWEQFTKEYQESIELALQKHEIQRNAIWTECLAVGGAEFTDRIKNLIRNRIRLEREETQAGVWTVREALASYD